MLQQRRRREVRDDAIDDEESRRVDMQAAIIAIGLLRRQRYMRFDDALLRRC